MTKPNCNLVSTTIKELADLPSGSLKVLQLSDPHLFADQDGRLLGMRTLKSFIKVLNHATKTLGQMDLVVVTGDLVHDATAIGYSRLGEHLATLGIPVYCLPGNHDDTALIASTFSDNPSGSKISIQHNNWSIILLDSQLPGSESGHISSSQLAKLAANLQAHPNHHTMICLHHQAIPIGSTWLDTMTVDNADDFFAIVDQHPQVKAISWGHVHQDFEAVRNGVKLFGTPSTCFQFTPKKETFGIDKIPPGCRWLALLPDGQITTGLVRIKKIPTSIDLSGSGY
ncbi:3',5'-cyclic-nucleotide phosphodiesterase [hydrothermal vent metagenome]|uniref:3',5'-cyclic-nucleotide phosphodiesterase n=1 Tax=hydrothermal vent metagenome TaxID=652676 RepID=A0A3B1BJ99_9ZZZZ